jgi:hypothetical protein
MDAIHHAASRPAVPHLRSVLASALLLACVAGGVAPAHAQGAAGAKDKAPKAPKAEKPPKTPGEKRVPPFFQSETPLALTFTTNIKQIRRDKGESAPWREATLTYQDSASKTVAVPVKARTRGVWRLKQCQFPPIRLNFADKSSKETLFDDLERPKLVNYCRDTDQYEQYILQEAQLYRIYQLLTPISHRVRLTKISYVDSASGKRDAERYAIIVEDPDQLANRLLAQVVKAKGASFADFEAPQLALAYIFQYMIGNVDFSFNGLHNTELLGTSDGRILPVAYDFDFAGAVNTAYAAPPPHYQMQSVRQRKFVGPCGISAEYPGALAVFMEKKAAIYALYSDKDPIGRLMDQRVARETLRYFDDFYDATRTPERATSNVFNYCIKPR